MTPQARAQAAIEVLDQVVAAARDAGPAADTILASYFKARRYAGSGDRRAVRELVYRAIRRAGERPASGRAALAGLAEDDHGLAALFDGSAHGPTPVAPDEPRAPAGIAPAWLAERLSKSIGEGGLPALLDRAPLDIRVNALRATREEVLADIPDAVPIPGTVHGLRLPEGSRVEALPGWQEGRFEVQDGGSQMVSAWAEARPGMCVVDLCAGAGGKTLALAADMGGEGRILACDTDRGRLQRLPPRAARAGVIIAETRLLDPGKEAAMLADMGGAADLVLIDAPCSGTGTWRRNPEARWRLTPDRLARLVETQRRLIGIGAGLVRPGGRLVYIVCSLLDEEGAGQLGALPAGWTVESRGLSPATDGTDGFFFASATNPC